MELEDVIGSDGLLGLRFGATCSQAIETLGPAEDRTDRGSTILKYGDLQLTFEEGEGLWLATIWNVTGRLRLHSEDFDVEWRVSMERFRRLLAGMGLGIPRSAHSAGDLISGTGPHFDAQGAFDDEGLLEKLSLVRRALSHC